MWQSKVADDSKVKKLKNPVLPEHILEFGAYIDEYQQKLNMLDWRIEPSSQTAPRGHLACIQISLEDRLASWSLGNNWGAMPVTSQSLRETAVHELLHPFLRPLIEAAASRDPDATAAAEHAVIAVLEKILTKP